ncbi:acetyl-CoA carboxylase biotin carboxyl carrier protein subunit [Flavobacterium sp. CYK-4]|uniref:acetyl-CoA carboxylase biotin carboxyl carrier protein subunit n=1 Tax=Flavobacterium lotistagni TaxID=2709660 RepID=UPI00140CF261|nr:acetyl-CoA carboxylase biotin carboxyl carrier protein subunit [Flavobacterium lotistagni]NHM06261.1 acetyl-CoA carboxylase biotin carboxyl carrier protein subunit [Flavobacterium lotistagni]
MSDYKVKVSGGFEFELGHESLSQLDAVSVEKDKFHILQQNQPYRAEILSADFNQKKYTVKVNNNTYSVSIAGALDQLIQKMGFDIGATKQINAIKAPMPGLIIEIGVSVGQEVKENDNLLILSAMKMENSFLSPRDGVIKSIAVAVGDAVEKGQLLVEFE